MNRIITNQIVIISETETKKYFEIETIDGILLTKLINNRLGIIKTRIID